MTETAPTAAKRERFVFLDAMRGVAALGVLDLHAVKLFALPSILYLKGQLMVDFFFCLSGFVLAFAHSSQLQAGTLSTGRFMTLRFVRIWPMLVMGTVLGAVATLAIQPELTPSPQHVPAATLLSLICLPFLENGKFLWLDGVFWSLFAELLVNFLFAAFVVRLKDRSLLILTGALALAFGVTSYLGYGHRLEDVADLIPTAIRACASFFAGVLVYRAWDRKLVTVKAPWWALLLTLCVVMILPIKNDAVLRSIVMVLLVSVVFPFIVLTGAACQPPFERWAERLGRASFPLYAVHAPIIAMVAFLCAGLPVGGRIVAMLLTSALVLVAALILADAYEAPFRRRLRRALDRNRLAAPKPTSD